MERFTLHEAVSKAFDRTPNGTIFTRDLKTIYSLMIICLNLTEHKPKSKMSFLTKQYDYSFTSQEAINIMGNLSLNIESSSTSTTVSYSIKSELAASLLKTFFTSKLLHTPADRTRDEPKNKVLLQPTPKGVAIIQSYCKLNGIKDHSRVPIIRSDFNSMNLFLFERSPITGTIIYSEYFIHLLFSRFVGPHPNVWNATNSPDEIPSLEHRLQMDDEFDFSNFNDVIIPISEQPLDLKKTIFPNFKQKSKARESPFHHTSFTNPESDSHVQYYVSYKGVRLYQNCTFGDVKIEYCFNAKAAWQWIMDCTDIMYPQETTNILNLFYRYGLIEPIILPPSTATSQKSLLPKKTSFYTLSKKGWDISHWNGSMKQIHVANGEEITIGSEGITLNNQAVLQDNASFDEINPINRLDQLDIKKVLSDPGMRYLFRLHLEKEYCAENLDVYIDIRYFTKKMTILMSILEIQKKPPIDNQDLKTPSKRAIVKLINECLSSAYNIYSSYVTIGAPYQLNIDHRLRELITQTMLHTTSPLRSKFDELAMIDSTIPSPPEPAYLRGVPSDAESTLRPAPEIRSARVMNNKNLSIEVPTVDAEDFSSPMTPTEEEMNRSLRMLEMLFPLVDQVGKQILKMLEFDSFPKFLASDTLRGALE